MAKRVFLSITDLHYADENANFTDDAKDLGKSYGGAFRTRSFTKFHALLEHGFEPNELDFVAIVGDITTHGQKVGFADFCKEAVPQLERLVPEHAICIVPGNHDVRWALDPNQSGYFNEKFEDFTDMVDQAHATTCLFPIGEVKPDPQYRVRFRRPKRGPLYVDDRKQILVLNINSALRCGELHKEMYNDFVNWHGAPIDLAHKASTATASKTAGISRHFLRDIAQFTQEQLEELQDVLKREKKRLGENWDKYLKVALAHHHVVHYPGQTIEHKGYEFMLDSSLLLEFLTGFDFDLILTGHKHHAYEMVHRFGDKEIFIVGGSTVGGYQSGQSFRGIRLIEFDGDQKGKALKIRNISEDLSQSDVRKAIGKVSPISLSIPLTEQEILSRSRVRDGFSYRAMIATTKITEYGDAMRTVLCDELTIVRQCDRAREHVVTVPSTSGYIGHFRASSSDRDIDISDINAPSFIPKTATMRLSFRPKLSINELTTYQYDWTAVNGFALDKAQFKRMYPDKKTPLTDTEFTHFQPGDPVETLILLVQLPAGFKFVDPPHLRVARPDPTVSNSRLWQLDPDATKALKAAHAMTFLPLLNTIELRVQAPDPNLSYGIEWKLPDGVVRRNSEKLPPLIRSLEQKSPLSPKILYKALSGVRKVLLGGWDGQFDMNLMVFGFSKSPGMLKSISAGRFTQLIDGAEPKAMNAMSTDITIPYGLGIAGRALRANRSQIHVSSAMSSGGSDQDNLDFYLHFDGSLDLKKLICIPLHLPVSERDFLKQPNVYATLEPYGVLNIGSEDEDCPLSPELVSGVRSEAELKILQHKLSTAMAEALFGNHYSVQKRPKTVEKKPSLKHK